MDNATETNAAYAALTGLANACEVSPLELEHASAHLFAALARAQAKAETVGKDAKNTDRGYNYATADAMARAARLAMAETGLAVFASFEVRTLPEPLRLGNQWVSEIVVEHFVLSYGDTDGNVGYVRGTATMPSVESRGRAPDKARMAAQTYMHGFVLRNLLNLDRNDEGDAAVDRRNDGADDDGGDWGPRGDRRPPRAPRGRDPEPRRDAPRAGERRVVSEQPASHSSEYESLRAQLSAELTPFLDEYEKEFNVRRDWHDVLSETLGDDDNGQPLKWPNGKATPAQMQTAIAELKKARHRLANPHDPTVADGDGETPEDGGTPEDDQP